jgi:hypothetical protein
MSVAELLSQSEQHPAAITCAEKAVALAPREIACAYAPRSTARIG